MYRYLGRQLGGMDGRFIKGQWCKKGYIGQLGGHEERCLIGQFGGHVKFDRAVGCQRGKFFIVQLIKHEAFDRAVRRP